MNKNSMVSVWKEKITIPTYPAGKPDKNPMFFEKRVYQGSSGVVYPNPIIEKIYDEKKEKSYTGLFLENKYLKIMILPELGGRVQMAYDKVKERHFVYYNQVIKSALVGLLGPWISGGIEFNWPQHHRPSTFQPVDFTTETHADGSKTIWINEVELMFHTKGLAGFTLHPGKAYLEINVQLYNRTNLPQTFLWWANPAVQVNDDYQSVFPPDVNAVFDHGKRDVSTFPVATGTYYKIDYSPGTDISRYKNIPVPTSYMAIQSDYDFVGGYEHDTEGGLLHVANHHVSPGKKQWTWGNGDFGKAWDRNLTDEDGPYVELMAGVYTDNQPDFSWLMPYEEKTFSQYFMPYQKLGVIKNATKDILINIEPDGAHKADIKIYATSEQTGNRVKLYIEDELVFEDSFDVSPESVYKTCPEFTKKIKEKNYKLIVENSDRKELIRYEPAKNKTEDIPDPAKPAKAPEDIENNEQLYLTGLHLEQYRHATYSPVPYYEEALRRDPNDIRNSNALGKWYLRRGRFEKSESYFQTAIKTLTNRNPNPYDGEPFYNLGLCLKYQGRFDEAYKFFYKTTWNSAWQDKGYFALAEIDTTRNEYNQALEHINRALEHNTRNGKAWTLKAVLHRKQNDLEEAFSAAEQAVERDPFNLPVRFEQHLIYRQTGDVNNAEAALEEVLNLSRRDVQNLISYALDYASAGLYEEAIAFLSHGLQGDEVKTHPMVFYYLGWFHSKQGEDKNALSFYRKGANARADYCFPNRLEAIPVLYEAQKLNPEDSKAPYYLGCLFYDKRQYDLAISQWELSAGRDDRFPTVHRNLGIAYFNKRDDAGKSISNFEKAFSLDTSDARILMELDQLYKRTNLDPEKRLTLLEKHLELVEFRDDLYLERAALYNFLGQHEKAYDLIMSRKFHPWEGGEGKVSGQYVYSLTEMAKIEIHNENYNQAITKLEKARIFPPSLGEGKIHGTKENDIYYWLGVAHHGLGEFPKAKHYWVKATKGDDMPEIPIYYNDRPPEKIFYQGLAWLMFNEHEKAHAIFQKMIDHGKNHMEDKIEIDYFATSLPNLMIFDDDLSLRNKIHCLFMIVLGSLGKGNFSKTKSLLQEILDKESMHFGAKVHLKLMKWFETSSFYQKVISDEFVNYVKQEDINFG